MSDNLTKAQIQRFEKTFEVFIDSFSGAMGGCIAQLIFYPFENLRVRVQSIKTQDLKGKALQLDYFKFIKEILDKEGFFAFYKGLSTAMVATFFSFAVYFFWYRFWKNFFYGYFKKTELKSLDLLAITTISGILNSIITAPLWFVNNRVINEKSGVGFVQTLKQICQEEGVGAFYKGLAPNLLLVSNPVINYMVYEEIKKRALQSNFSMSTLQIFALSSFSKLVATLATYPVLTVKVKVQNNKASVNTVHFVLNLLKESGFLGLYVGLNAKLVQTVLYNAFQMTSYEKMRLFIKFAMIKYLRQQRTA